MSFTIGDKGYYGTGHYVVNNGLDFVPLRDFWEYDPASDSWTQKADLAGSPRYRAAGFTIGNKGYIGTGRSYDSTCACYYSPPDFWQYTPDCEVPSGLTTTNIKSNMVKVNWNAVAAEQTYSVRYRKTGTAPWIKTTASINFRKLTGLLSETQ